MYTFATVLCVCGRQVGRVPPAPGYRRCVCGARLSFTEDTDGLRPSAWYARKLRAWNRRRPAILAAGKEAA